MVKSLVTTVLVIWVLLYMVICHAVLMACRQAKVDPTSLADELKPIADVIPHDCPQFPVYIFSISDYLIHNHPVITEELLEFTASGLTGISCIFEVVMFSGFLLTYAENLAFL